MIAALVLLALSIADVVTTRMGISRGLSEGGPIIARFIKWLGVVPGVIVGKALIMGAVIAVMRAVSPDITAGLWAAAAVTGAVVVWNVVQLRRSG